MSVTPLDARNHPVWTRHLDRFHFLNFFLDLKLSLDLARQKVWILTTKDVGLYRKEKTNPVLSVGLVLNFPLTRIGVIALPTPQSKHHLIHCQRILSVFLVLDRSTFYCMIEHFIHDFQWEVRQLFPLYVLLDLIKLKPIVKA
jgi:hypothetical protein